MKNRLLLLLALFPILLQAQLGGDQTYEFLTLPHTARVGGLGGSLIMIKDDDAALAFQNPSLLNEGMHQQLNFNTNFFPAGINHGYAGYSHHFKKPALSTYGGIQYVAYGNFKLTDETGQVLGDFKASEYAISFGVGRQYTEKLSYGANLKMIISNLESYNSFGLAADLGFTYADTTKKLTMALVAKNIGAQVTTYTPEGSRQAIPADLQFGIAKRLKHLPFRFSALYHHLHQWNIRYDDPNKEETTSLFGEEDPGPSKVGIFVDNLFRHFIFGGELLAGKQEVFRLRFAYNHQRRAELNVENTRSLAGFSTGLGIKIKQFRFDYGMSVYHIAGTAHQISISTRLGEF